MKESASLSSSTGSEDGGSGDDVTQILLQAIKDTKWGQIHQTERFNIHQAMNATEIMDARMDSGMNVEHIYTVQVVAITNRFRKRSLWASSDVTHPFLTETSWP